MGRLLGLPLGLWPGRGSTEGGRGGAGTAPGAEEEDAQQQSNSQQQPEDDGNNLSSGQAPGNCGTWDEEIWGAQSPPG